MIETRETLEFDFSEGKVPTAGNFKDLIDSYFHRTQDGVFKFEPSPETIRFGVGVTEPAYRLGIQAEGTNEKFISFHDSSSDSVHVWSVNRNPGGDTNTGFNIAQELSTGSISRFFIQEGTGNTGFGTTNPFAKIHIEDSLTDGLIGLHIRNDASIVNEGWTIGQEQNSDQTIDSALSFTEKTSIANEQRAVMLPGGKFGLGVVPDVQLHASVDPGIPEATIALIPGTGIFLVGPVTQNLAFDYQSIQAREATYVGSTLNITPADLHLQPLGGNIIVNGSNPEPVKRAVITADAMVGIGTMAPQEKLDVNGGIRIGDTSTNNIGTLRYTAGGEFQGMTPDGWVSFAGVYSPWEVYGNMICYDKATAPRVGVGTDVVNATFAVKDAEAVVAGKTAYMLQSQSVISNGGPNDNRVAMEVQCSTPWGGHALSKNIAFYVSSMDLLSARESNIAAVMNGNCVIGDLIPNENVIGIGGANVLALQKGVAPTTRPANTVQMYSDGALGSATLCIRAENNDLIKLYTEAALSPVNNTEMPADYGTDVIIILNNMRTRINELEARLQGMGLIGA